MTVADEAALAPPLGGAVAHDLLARTLGTNEPAVSKRLKKKIKKMSKLLGLHDPPAVVSHYVAVGLRYACVGHRRFHLSRVAKGGAVP